MSRFKNFTDEEIYVIKHAFMEAGFEFNLDNYSEDLINLYNKLYNEITKEDADRLYSEDSTNTAQIESAIDKNNEVLYKITFSKENTNERNS